MSMKKIAGTVNPSILPRGMSKAWAMFPEKAMAPPLLMIF